MRRVLALSIGVLVLFAFNVQTALASAGRALTGSYELLDVVDQGDIVSVTLAVRIFNYGDEDVIGATVWLSDPLGIPGTEAALGTIDTPRRASARVSGTIDVSRQEYERWLAGGMPHLRLGVTGSTGETTSQSVEADPGVTGSDGIIAPDPGDEDLQSTVSGQTSLSSGGTTSPPLVVTTVAGGGRTIFRQRPRTSRR